MSEDKKKKRIAHIGNISGFQGTSKGPNDEALAQADCNLVYDIMQSMDRSQIMSYQQLQEFRIKEGNSISRTNYSEQTSGKPNLKTAAPKQIKKLQEKTFPLMAKCQKSMTFLKKNRCIPKPRAHVGFIPKPPQKPIPDIRVTDTGPVSANKQSHNKSSKTKQKSKKFKESLEEGCETKISHSMKSSCDKNCSQKRISEKTLTLNSNTEADSDNDFEKFLIEHHPSNLVESSNDSSDFSASSRKSRKGKKAKRKKRKPTECLAKTKKSKLICEVLSEWDSSADSSSSYRKSMKGKKAKRKKNSTVCLAKTKKSKITNKVLSESEDSAESVVERHENNRIGVDKYCSTRFPSTKFKRIVENDNSDDSVSDTILNDTGAVNCDSSDVESEHLSILPAVPSPVASLPELSDSSRDNFSKSKCKLPCYVVIKRDPLLEQRVSLCAGNSSDIKMAPVIDVCDDDDCIIINETEANDKSRNFENAIANKYSHQENFTGIEKYTSDSEILIGKSVKKTHSLEENRTFISSGCKPLTERNALLSTSKLVESAYGDKDIMEVQIDEISVKETTKINGSSKIWPDVGNNEVKNVCTIGNKTGHSGTQNMYEYSLENPEKEILHEESSTVTENDTFNVQIISVTSLNESEVIVLSDDSCENDLESGPIISESNRISADDHDVEIVCLDLNSINKEKSVSGNVSEDLNSRLINEANSKLHVSDSSNQPKSLEEDCIILDNAEIKKENIAKCVTGTQLSSQSNRKTVDNADTGGAIADKNSDFDKNSILKILDTIDFNCIKKVLIETTTQAEIKSETISSGAESLRFEDATLNRANDSLDVAQNQKVTCIAKQATINDAINFSEASAMNKSTSSKVMRVDTFEEDIKVVKHVNVDHRKKNSENMSRTMNLSNVPPISNIDESSNSNISALMSPVIVKESVDCKPLAKLNTSLLPQKNQQLLPRCTKIENSESSLDTLDILFSKSIQNLEEKRKKTIMPLVELYQAEYKKFMDIRCTEENVTAGLKLLEENQAKKLMQISSSIKNIVENDGCFHKVKDKFVSNRCDLKSFKETGKPLECVSEPSSSSCSNIQEDDKVKIFNDAVVEGASEILNLKSVGASSSQKIYNHLINSMCVECGKQAMAACLGCGKIFFCSEKCGMSYWDKGHYATCKR